MAAPQKDVFHYDGTKSNSIQQLKIVQKIRSPVVPAPACMSDGSEKEKIIVANALVDDNRYQAGREIYRRC